MRIRTSARWRVAAGVVGLALAATACASDDTSTEPEATDSPSSEAPDDTSDDTPDADGALVVYSGRGEDLVGTAFEMFTEETGIEVEVRYGDTAELAATILEEGDASPADVYWAQDAGALGALAAEGRFTTLSDAILDRVGPTFRSDAGEWVGVTGRARTVVYNTDEMTEADVPASVLDLTDPAWEGKVGWAPTNGSFQAFVTAMRVTLGEDTTREWLEGMIANGVREYPKNTPIVEAVGRGEIQLGLVNHYYLFRFLAEDPEFPAANAFLSDDVGGLVNVAGVGILNSTERSDAAEAFVEWLLGESAQTYFSGVRDELEYPLAVDVPADPDLPALDTLNPPAIDLSDLDDLQGTLELLADVGALQ